MKTSRFLIVAAGALFFVALSANAEERPGSPFDPSANALGSRSRTRSANPVKGLQLASGLQTGALNSSGPGPIAVRISEDDWRRVFPRKEAGK